MTRSRSWREWVVPPAVSSWAARRSGGLTVFDDSVSSWHEASEQSTGYDSQLIIDRVRSATQLVLDGQAAFERDGVTFTSPEYRWPVLAGLLQVAATDGELRVLDFGGSLGSAYWQNRNLLTGFPVFWGVVEQPEFIAAGRALEQDSVNFFDSIIQYCETGAPNVILLSSVLQYLPNPDHVLRDFLGTAAHTLIIDRTPMSNRSVNLACVQKVPQNIYQASYPAWIFSRTWLADQFRNWSILAVFEGIEPIGVTTRGVEFSWDGLIAKRTQNA